MNVWRMTDENEYWLYPVEWTHAEVLAHYVEYVGMDVDDMDGFPEAVTEEELDTLKIAICDENEQPTGETQTMREFRKEFESETEPTYFCGGPQ